MGEVHEIAARGFGAEAVAYDRARPSYPPDAVAWLAEKLRIAPGRRVVDLAAGTGKLTGLLADAGADLVAVEPVAAMRDRLHQQLPAVPLLAAVAESLPFASGSVDAVVVAQAFHWFDARQVMTELGRVVRPGGRLGLVWNARDRSLEWVDRVWSVMDRAERKAPWRDGPWDGAAEPGASTRRSTRRPAGTGTGGWSPWVEATFSHVQRSSHEEVVDRMRRVSHIAVLPPDAQQSVLDEIRTILRENPATSDKTTVGIPYRVDAMYTERLG